MSKHVFLLPLFAVACSESAAERHDPRPHSAAAKVEVATAALGATPQLLTLTGKIIADQRAEITADTQGKVLEILVERGQRVRRGQPVVRLDVMAAAISTQEASAHLAAARSDQRLATIECGRTKTLFEVGAISRSEFDRQTATCASAGAQVAAAQARQAGLAKGVRDGIVRAPFDGIVSDRAVTAGEWVSPGRPLFTLVDADPLKLELSVPEASVPLVELGQDITVATVARPNRTYHATVTRLAAEIGKTRSLIVEATVEPTPELVPGMFVEAKVVTGTDQLPLLPAAAVVRRGKTWHVFVIGKGVVEERIVQLGPDPGKGRVSILQNLANGDRVVAKVTAQITDGLQVAE